MSYLRRLDQAYRNIKNSRVVLDKDTDADALAELKGFVDSIIPINKEEEVQEQLLKTLYFGERRRQRGTPSSKDMFVSLLPTSQRRRDAINYRCVVLITEARRIVEEFKIKNLVYIEWDPVNREYQIYPKLNLPPKREKKIRSDRPKDEVFAERIEIAVQVANSTAKLSWGDMDTEVKMVESEF